MNSNRYKWDLMRKVRNVTLRLSRENDMGYASQRNGLKLAATFNIFEDEDTVKVLPTEHGRPDGTERCQECGAQRR